jgi:hypothetical protein
VGNEDENEIDPEKKDVERNGSVKEEPAGGDDMEYPTGISFAFIIVALVLSIFLVSLDMVRFPVTHQLNSGHHTSAETLTRVSRLSSQLPFPKSQTSFTG